MINKFIIIGEARSGTTSLTGSINSGLRTPENRFWSNGIESQPVLGEPFTLLFKRIDDPDLALLEIDPYIITYTEKTDFSPDYLKEPKIL